MQVFTDRLFSVNEALLSHPSAERAINLGTLRAKRSAGRTATVLSWLSWPLLVAVLLVSFIHLAEQVARVVPGGTSTLKITEGMYNLVALANTALVDTIALYLVAVASIAHFTGQKAGRLQWFYLAMTLFLNAGYVLRHYPGVNVMAQPVLVGVDIFIAALLILMVPVSIYGVEKAQRVVEHIRLALLAEVTAYEEILKAQESEQPEEVSRLREALTQLQAYTEELKQSLQDERTGAEREIARLAGLVTQAEQYATRMQYERDELVRAARKPLGSLLPVVVDAPAREVVPAVAEHVCDVCHTNTLSATEKGIAGRAKWQQVFGKGVYACRSCRTAVEQQA